ncbi:MAG: alpha/beta fold hydrolase [Granulosicoccaceae bacterium]
MLIKQKITTVLTTLLIVQLAACSSDDKTAVSFLKWESCENVEILECASMKVPLDYSQPDGMKIDIALIRRAATGNNRKGSLLFNPGGPGGSGVALIRDFAAGTSIPESILTAYDLIGFDPRGVGSSTAVDCAEEGIGEIETYPLDADQISEMHNELSQHAERCAIKYGDYLQHLGSKNVVRDMDQIRIALNDEKLNFIGYSYGTRLAALYLQDFPETSGRIVLDGSVLPESSVRGLVVGQLPALQSNLLAVLSLCEAKDPVCNASALLNKLTQRVKILAVDPSDAAQDEFGLVGELLIAATEDPEFAETAAEPLVEYINTLDVSTLDMFVQQLAALDMDIEVIDEENNDDSETAGAAVLCADDATRPDVVTLVSALDELNQVSDLFAEAQLPSLGSCAGWPTALEPLAPIVTSTAPISLVIGGSTDAQTPLSWSKIMAAEIGGIFIKSDHQGHTGVFNDRSDCIDDIVEAFLLNGITPVVDECV